MVGCLSDLLKAHSSAIIFLNEHHITCTKSKIIVEGCHSVWPQENIYTLW